MQHLLALRVFIKNVVAVEHWRWWTVVVVVVGARYRRSTIGRESLMSGRSGRVRTGGPLAKTRIHLNDFKKQLQIPFKDNSIETNFYFIFFFQKLILLSLG